MGKKKKKKRNSRLQKREFCVVTCVCVRAFSSSGAFRIDRLSSSIVSRREKGTEEKEEGETRAVNLNLRARSHLLSRRLFEASRRKN